MAEIRLSKLTKQFSIGLARLVDFLNEKGANVEMNPNAKVSDEYLPAIEAKFGEDQKLKKDSEKVTIKLKEIIEMGSKKKPGKDEEEIPEREVVIKSNVLNEERPVESAPVVKPEPVQSEETKVVTGPKIIDKIDLSQFEKKAAPEKVEEKPAPAPEPVKKPEPEPVPVAEQPAPVPAPTPAEVPAESSEPREVKVEVEKLAGPKVVDKIDLSQFDKKKKKKKRERIGKEGSQKVDVTKVEATNNAGKKDKKDKNHPNNNAAQQQNASAYGNAQTIVAKIEGVVKSAGQVAEKVKGLKLCKEKRLPEAQDALSGFREEFKKAREQEIEAKRAEEELDGKVKALGIDRLRGEKEFLMELKREVSTVSTLEQELALAKDAYSSQQAKIAPSEELVAKEKEELVRLEEEHERRMQSVTDAVKDMRARLAKALGAEDNTCPVCGQLVVSLQDDAILDAEAEKAEKERDAQKQKCKDAESAFAKL